MLTKKQFMDALYKAYEPEAPDENLVEGVEFLYDKDGEPECSPEFGDTLMQFVVLEANDLVPFDDADAHYEGITELYRALETGIRQLRRVRDAVSSIEQAMDDELMDAADEIAQEELPL